MFFKLISIVTVALVAASGVSAAPSAELESRKVRVIADGNGLRVGRLKEKPWYYYADAKLESGACPPAISAQIPGCLTVTLPADVTKGQQGQLRTPLVPADGSTYRSWWTSNIPSNGINVPGTELFHLFELYSSGGGAFSFVELRQNNVYFQIPNSPGVYNGPDPLFGFTDRNAYHELELVTGPNGKVDFNVTDKVTGERLLTFLWLGQVGGPDISVRVGARREPGAGQTKFVEHIGELYFAKVA